MTAGSSASTAYHEAGHAIAAWASDLKLKRVSIVPIDDALGHVLHANPLKGIRLDIDGRPQSRYRAERAIIVCLAGPTAQQKYDPASVDPAHASADFETASDLAVRLCGSARSATAYLAWLQVVADDIIETRWAAVERVAGALLERGTLSGSEIDATLYPVRRIVPKD